MDDEGYVIFSFDRVKATSYEWRWRVVKRDSANQRRIATEWWFGQDRSLISCYDYVYDDDGSLLRVDRLAEHDELVSRYYPVHASDGGVDYYEIRDLDGNVIGDTRDGW